MRIEQQINEIKKVAIMTFFIFVFLIIFSILIFKVSHNDIKSFRLSNTSVENSRNKIEFTGSNIAQIYNTETNSIEKINIEEYIKCVVASEMPANFNSEALKAQAIAARTFYFSRRIDKCKIAHGADICNSTHCQVYKPKEECLKKWSADDREKNWKKITSAVDSTKGEILIYKGKIVEYPQYFSTSWGKTESAKEVLSKNIPYLASTESDGEQVAPKYTSTAYFSTVDFINKVQAKYKNSGINQTNINESVKIIANTRSGSVKQIKLGNKTITGREFRTLLGLNSPDFQIDISNSQVKITCKGYGHGLGMSQWGANIMGKNGSSYKEILKHYYSGIDIGKAYISGK